MTKRSEKHEKLVSYVKENSNKLFGEDFDLDNSVKLKGQYSKDICPDLVGKDSKNLIIIIEIKTEFDSDADSTNKRDAAHKSVGQVLNYAYAYMEQRKPWVELKDYSKHLRLFIVGKECLKTVEDICHLLRMHGINIRHISTE